MSYFLQSGEEAFDRSPSHIHLQALPYIEEAIKQIWSDDKDYIIKKIPFGSDIGYLYCVTVKPTDEFIYAKRKGRKYYTRFVKGKKPKKCNSMMVILKRNIYGKKITYRIISAFIGVSSDTDQWSNHNELQEKHELLQKKISYSYWKKHALIWGSEEIQEDTILTEKEYFKETKKSSKKDDIPKTKYKKGQKAKHNIYQKKGSKPKRRRR